MLLTAVALVTCGYLLDHAGTDEGVLTAQAASQILHGHPVYSQSWPWLFDSARVGITKTMSGGADYTYGYPPLTPLLVAPVLAALHSAAAATLVTTGVLLVSSVLLWFLLPAPWRSAATAVCLGFGFLPHYAYAGYPAITALALLVPVVVRRPDTGAGGQLGGRGVLVRERQQFVRPLLQQGPERGVPARRRSSQSSRARTLPQADRDRPGVFDRRKRHGLGSRCEKYPR